MRTLPDPERFGVERPVLASDGSALSDVPCARAIEKVTKHYLNPERDGRGLRTRIPLGPGSAMKPLHRPAAGIRRTAEIVNFSAKSVLERASRGPLRSIARWSRANPMPGEREANRTQT